MRRCHLLLSKLLAGAVRFKRISRNPCADTDNLPTVHRAEMRVIAPDQILRLADAMADVTTERLGRERRSPGVHRRVHRPGDWLRLPASPLVRPGHRRVHHPRPRRSGHRRPVHVCRQQPARLHRPPRPMAMLGGRRRVARRERERARGGCRCVPDIRLSRPVSGLDRYGRPQLELRWRRGPCGCVPGRQRAAHRRTPLGLVGKHVTLWKCPPSGCPGFVRVRR